MNRCVVFLSLILFFFAHNLSAEAYEIVERDVAVSDKITLKVAECGRGQPIVFIHGSTGDHTVWHEHLPVFAEKGYRAIAYSRRYNWPNKNDLEPNHSAIVEAEDLFLLTDALELNSFHLVGHSYGGYTALIFALKHPLRLRSLTLAEPPIVPWLKEIKGEDRDAAVAHYQKLYEKFIIPARREFNAGNDKNALRVFLDTVAFKDAIDRLPKTDVEICRRNMAELRALVKSHNSYPLIGKLSLSKNKVPTLLVSGGASNDVGKYTDPYLMQLLPEDSRKRVIIPGANHIMWKTHPKQTNAAVLRFINKHKELDEQSAEPKDHRSNK